MKRTLFAKCAAALLPLVLLLSCFTLQASATAPDTSTPRKLHITKFLVDNLGAFDAHGDGTQLDLTDLIEGGTITPVQGIKFAVVKAYTTAEKAAALLGGAQPGEFEECEGANGYWYKPADVASASNQVTTDSSGLASKAFASDGSQDGDYYVVELPDSRVAAPVDPFIISVPLENPASPGTWLYDVYVYPKNGQLEIGKSFATGDPVAQDFSVGDEIVWKITVDIPFGIGSATKFEVSDTLNSVFTYVAGSVEVYIAGTDTEITGFTETFASPTLKLDFAPCKAALAAYEGEKLEITFTTILNNTAVVGSATNGAALTYNDSAPLPTPLGANPTASYNAVAIDKFDGRNSTNKLAGAAFQIATSSANATGGDFLKKDSNGYILDVGDDGYATADDWIVTTGTDGDAIFGGLAFGSYYIAETAAPTGYNPLRAPVPVTVKSGAASYTVAGTLYTGLGSVTAIENYAGFTLPFTGGQGVMVFSVLGIALMGLAFLLFLVAARKKKAHKREVMYLV